MVLRFAGDVCRNARNVEVNAGGLEETAEHIQETVGQSREFRKVAALYSGTAQFGAAERVATEWSQRESAETRQRRLALAAVRRNR